MEVCDDFNDCYRYWDGEKFQYSAKVDGDSNGDKIATSNDGWSSTTGVYVMYAVFVLKIAFTHLCQLDRARGRR